jgi:hypothetical protein
MVATLSIGAAPMTAESSAFNWRLPLYAAAGTFLVFLPFALCSADLGEFFYVCLAAPIVSLILIVIAFRRRGRYRQSTLSMLIIFWIISAALVAGYSAVRDVARWSLWSRGYKAQVLGRRISKDGELKHIAWDGWGFTGADTIEYLVFDPSDSLGALPRKRTADKSNGLPCKVWKIRRLEINWYAVTFYTDSDWDHCS